MAIEERAWRPVVRSLHGVVSSGHYLASAAGCRVLEKGGNATDAGVAAGLVLNVVHADMCTVSGVAPIITYDVEGGRARSYCGVGTWPIHGQPSQIRYEAGVLPIAHRWIVPAALASWVSALSDSGTMDFASVAADAIRLARGGYPMYEFQYFNLGEKHAELERWPENVALFRPGGEHSPGVVITQVALASTLEALVKAEQNQQGSRHSKLQAVLDYFYSGPVASALSTYAEQNGSWLRQDDFSQFTVPVETPPSIKYRDYEVFACGPWSQGMVLLQALGILEGFDFSSYEHNSTPFIHLVAEALNLAFADREGFYGDPGFVDVPIGKLLSKSYLAHRKGMIKEGRAFGQMPPPGEGGFAPQRPDNGLDPLDVPRDTSYVAVIDGSGNLFSATPSDALVSSPLVPSLGLALSPRGIQFSRLAGSPNELAPGKRPRLTPSPAIVLRNGVPIMAIGTPGLDRQPQAILQVLLNLIEFGRNQQQAVELARFATGNFPSSQQPNHYDAGRLFLESTIYDSNVNGLTKLGHNVSRWPDRRWQAGGVCVVERNPTTGVISGGADPRRESYAVGI